MIINHKYKFIFLKTRKTAGTSIEIALSPFCDPNDVITPIAQKDELIRQELGSRGPQNYKIPLGFYTKWDWLRLLLRGKQMSFFNHMKAEGVKTYVDPEIWNTYFKFCFERNPFDKFLSRYYWSTYEPRPQIDDYVNSCPNLFLSDWEIYTINDHIVVDFIGRYETLEADLDTIRNRLGLPEKLSLPRAKGGYRSNRAHYSTVLSSQARSRIELVCAKEMLSLGYCWQQV